MRLLSAVFVVLAVGIAPRAQQPTLPSSPGVVPVLATVLDRDGGLVPALQKQDFTLLDNGKPQEIVHFHHDVRPLTVVVMLDFSFSMNDNFQRMRTGVEQFIRRMRPEDMGQIGAFNDKILLSGRFTNDHGELMRALELLPYGNPSRVYDAIDASINLLHVRTGRKVLLLLTDGEDTASRRRVDDVLAKARDEDVMIYAIALQSEMLIGRRMHRSRPDGTLRRLAKETGGGYFELKVRTDPAPAIARIGDELLNFYTLGFTPTKLDGKRHRLEIRVRSGITARARTTYIASQDRLIGTD